MDEGSSSKDASRPTHVLTAVKSLLTKMARQPLYGISAAGFNAMVRDFVKADRDLQAAAEARHDNLSRLVRTIADGNNCAVSSYIDDLVLALYESL